MAADHVDAALAAITDDEIVAIEKQLVSIPSYTTEEAELAEWIADFLNDEGIEVGLQRVSFAGVKGMQSRKSYNVIARIHGTEGGPSLMFNGHMDHGPIAGRNADDFSRWQRKPFEPVIEDGFLYGKGSQDEKGGICAMLTAAVAIRRARVQLRGDLIVAPVCGHKTFSMGSRHLVRSGLHAAMAINTENSGNGIVPLHVGVFMATIRVNGKHPHPAVRRRFPELQGQPTPFQQVSKVLEAFGPEARPYDQDSWLRFERHPVLHDFPWHHVEDVEAIGYAGAVAHVWWRTPPGVTEASLAADLDRLLARLSERDPTFRGSATVYPYGPALDTPFDAPVVQALARWHERVAGEPADVGVDGRYGGYGDAAVLAAAGMSAVAYGPGGGMTDLEYQLRAMNGDGPPDERIPVRDLIVAARTSTAAAVDLLT